jgi:hypothetical protein
MYVRTLNGQFSRYGTALLGDGLCDLNQEFAGFYIQQVFSDAMIVTHNSVITELKLPSRVNV